MRRMVAFLLGLMLLAGCSGLPDTEQPEQSVARESPGETEAVEKMPPEAQPDPSAPPPELVEQPSYWMENWLPLAIYHQQPNYRRGEQEIHPYNGPCRMIPEWLAQEGRLLDYPRTGIGMEYGEEDGIVMPLEEFLDYAGIFFGARYADLDFYLKEDQLAERIDRERGAITLPIPYGLDPDTGAWSRSLNDRTVDRIESFVVDSPDQGSLHKVRLQTTRYDDKTLRTIDRHEEYLFYWDSAVGFVVEESTWHWPDTDVVRVEGAARQSAELWGRPPGEALRSNPYLLDSVNDDPGLLASGGRLHRLRLEEDALLADSIDLLTLEQQTGRVLHRFPGEEFLLLRVDGDGAFVYTDRAAYHFGDDLLLLRRAEWPEPLRDGEAYRLVTDVALTRIAYAREGRLYTRALAAGSEPVLLAEPPAPPEDAAFDVPSLFPIRYLEDGRLFVGVSMWERVGAFQVLAPDGALVRELPFAVSGMHSGGNCIFNRAGALFAPMAPYFGDERLYRYEFEGDRLDELGWMDGGLGTLNAVCDPANPEVVYFTRFTYPDGADASAPVLVVTECYRLDLGAQTMQRLDLRVSGAEAYLLGADENGRLLLACAYKNEQMICVYDPNSL